MPDNIKDAKNWIENRHALITQGSNEIIISGKSYDATDLIDLRGQVMEGQVQHLRLKNQLKEYELKLKTGDLVDSFSMIETMNKILIPLKKSLDKLPSIISEKLNNKKSSQIIETELQRIYSDLQKQLNEHDS